MNVKYGMAKIPKFLPRIVVLNSQEYFWLPRIGIDLHEAIARRSEMFFLTAPCLIFHYLLKITGDNSLMRLGTN